MCTVRRPALKAVAGAGLVVVSCTAVQGSAAVCSTLFDTMGSTGVAAWRQMVGALTLLAVLHPATQDGSGTRETPMDAHDATDPCPPLHHT